jgi:hypothetical protein
MVMAVFAYIYHQSFIATQTFSVETIIDQVMLHILYLTYTDNVPRRTTQPYFLSLEGEKNFLLFANTSVRYCHWDGTVIYNFQLFFLITFKLLF